MSSTTEQCLSQTTAATFEELALVLPDTQLSPRQNKAPLDMAVTVEFHGPLSGRLVLRASATVLPVIAANMLGEEESRQHAMQRDALGELANVICGNLLPQIAGAEAVFILKAPRVEVEVESSESTGVPTANTA